MTDAHLAPESAAPEEDITTQLYRAAIGPVGADYYVPIFTRFEENDHAGITWNTVAALFTLHWLLFRQLYLYALAYGAAVLAVVLLVFGIGRVLFQFPPSLLIALGVGFSAMAVALPGLFGNALLHTEIRKRMAAAVAAHHNMTDARAALLARASKRRHGIALAGVQALLAAVVGVISWQAATLMPDEAPVAEAPPLLWTQPITQSPTASAASAVVPMVTPSTPASTPLATTPAAPASTPASAVPLEPASAPTRAPVSASTVAPPSALASAASAPAVALAASASASAPVPRTSTPAATRSAASAAAAAAPTKPAAAPPKSAAPKPKKATSAPAAAKPAAKAASKPKVQAKAAAKPAAAASAPTKPYYINVGLFAVAENLERVQSKLQGAQLPVVVTALKSKKGPMTRVRVGPFSNELEAQAAARKVKALQLDAVVVQPAS